MNRLCVSITTVIVLLEDLGASRSNRSEKALMSLKAAFLWRV